MRFGMFAPAKKGKLLPPGGKCCCNKNQTNMENSQNMTKNGKILKQSQLKLVPLKKSTVKKTNAKNDIILLPLPQPRAKTLSAEIDKTVKKFEENITLSHVQNRLLLGTRALLGKVDFCLRMHKQFPYADAIWDVYGKIINIKQDNILLLRNDSFGPILQAICQNSQDALNKLSIGAHVRAVGRFEGVNRLQVYKVQQISEEIWQYSFADVHDMVQNSLLSLPTASN